MNIVSDEGMKKAEWEAFFNQKGWKIFCSELLKDREDVNALLRSLDGVDLYRAQGAAGVIDEWIEWPEMQLNPITRSEDGNE